MAEHADPTRVEKIKPGARAVYPWTSWTDGEWWRLHQGVDYATRTPVFQSTARNYAKRNGFLLETQMTADGTLIRFKKM
jgi:hypothetical protein